MVTQLRMKRGHKGEDGGLENVDWIHFVTVPSGLTVR